MCGTKSIKHCTTVNLPGNHSSWYLEHPCYELMGKYLHIFYQWRYQYQPNGPVRVEKVSVTAGLGEARCYCHQYCWFYSVSYEIMCNPRLCLSPSLVVWKHPSHQEGASHSLQHHITETLHESNTSHCYLPLSSVDLQQQARSSH